MASVVSVSLDRRHRFSKERAERITLITGEGVEGDAHRGVTVKHRSRVRFDPSQPNLRQVHLIHAELFAELAARGFTVVPGDIGENITTEGIDLLALPTGARLSIGGAVIEVTGLRNPCIQLDRFQDGLMQAVLDRDAEGRLIRKAGIMGIVIEGGHVGIGDRIDVELPAAPHRPLEKV
ncbi:MAG: MOSC domain-containing protein [Phreatobacter sp.]|uniref:MOSC domain-containing protein n=1 Tax=Phreatobacter sp. TaxID=1966341 RepID=UPI001A53431C|nr:MOSC domain-containing protein [Phreatobacter sp.]MBL8569646.1 MOSC domain-containing protein [Phreatobacter sp.]